MGNLRVLVADDHALARKGVRALLEEQPGWEIVAEASNGREAVEKAKLLQPDVTILDLSMPELNGLEAAREILKRVPTKILILTIHEADPLIRQTLEAGARGYVLKSDAGRDLVAAAEALLEHKLSLSGKISELVLRAYLSKAPRPESQLTVREQETLELLAEGKSNKEVAEALQISVKTVEVHRSRLMKKLNLRNMGELMRYAVRKGIIVP